MARYVHENSVNAFHVGINQIGQAVEAFPDAVSRAVAVVVEQTGAADAQWNVLLNGQRLFSAGSAGVGINAADTPITFVPNSSTRANRVTTNETHNYSVEVMSASATEGSQLHVTVLTDDNREA